jgi:hypothetical protein
VIPIAYERLGNLPVHPGDPEVSVGQGADKLVVRICKRSYSRKMAQRCLPDERNLNGAEDLPGLLIARMLREACDGLRKMAPRTGPGHGNAE